MGLAAPTALLVGTGRGAQLGILIKGPEVLESTRTIDTIVLDKTGTITTGPMSLAGVVAAPGEDPDELLRLAGEAEDASGHPIGAAIASGARQRLGPALPALDEVTSHQGLGVTAVVDGHAVAIGRAGWLESEWAQPLPAALAGRAAGAEAAGQTAVFAGWDGRAVPDHQAATRAAMHAARTGTPPVLAWALQDTVADRPREETGEAFKGQPPGRIDRGPAGAGRRIRDLLYPDADGDPRRDHPLCAAGALPEPALEQLIAKARELDMDEVRASVAERGGSVPSGGA